MQQIAISFTCLCLLVSVSSLQAMDDKKEAPLLEIRLGESEKTEGFKKMEIRGTKKTILVSLKSVVSDQHIKKIRIDSIGGHETVTITFTKEGSKRLSEATGAHLNKPLALLLDGEVIIAPILSSSVSSSIQISAKFTREDIKVFRTIAN